MKGVRDMIMAIVIGFVAFAIWYKMTHQESPIWDSFGMAGIVPAVPLVKGGIVNGSIYRWICGTKKGK